MHVFLVHKIVVQCMKNNNEHYVSYNSPGSINVSEYPKGFKFSKSVENLLLVLFLLKQLGTFGILGELVKACI
jgi:hypothetical protein